MVLDLLPVALAYATRGLAVLPLHPPARDGCTCRDGARCASPGKHPLLRHGAHDASIDADVIGAWWRQWPRANVGIRTGDAMDACDIDSRDGLRHVLARLGGHGLGGPVVRTGSGWHLWFAATGYGSRVGAVSDVDWRGRGGYVLAPPSRHSTGRRYRWVRPWIAGSPLPACPPGLVALLESTRPAPAATTAIRGVEYPGRYVAAALEREVAVVLAAPRPRRDGGRRVPGGRNQALNRAAFSLAQLAGAGLLDPRLAWERLRSAGAETGLGAREVERTIASGWRAGLRHPRRLRL
jgi:hypothetical protein